MREIVLINVSGEDRPGSTALLTGILAGHAVQVLDIRQSVIHGAWSLGVLVQVAGAEQVALRQEVLALAESLSLRASFTDWSGADYDQWQAAGREPAHIVTLMGRELPSAAIARVIELAQQAGLQLQCITPLSAPVQATTTLSRACVELTLRGELADAAALQGAFLALADELGVDIGLQADSRYRCNRRLAVFDMDSTLIEAEVIDELAKAHGVGERVSHITERAMRGELDFKASFRERLALLKGLDISVLDAIGAQLRLTEGTERLFAELKRLGYKTAILSGGFTYFAKQLQARLGIDYVFANELEVVNGQCTGVAVEPIVDAQRKADLLQQLAAEEGLSLDQTVAVGDGANDLPMLALAGLGVAFRAKPLVRQSAKQAISTLGLDGVLYLLGQPDRP